MGIKFQTKAKEKPSEIIFHFRLHDRDASAQQECVGILGTNLMYASFNYFQSPKKIIKSLSSMHLTPCPILTGLSFSIVSQILSDPFASPA